MLGARVTVLQRVNACEELFPGAEEDWRDGQVHLAFGDPPARKR